MSRALILGLVSLFGFTPNADAALIFQTATGNADSTTGATVGGGFVIGARFEVSEETEIDSIGGFFKYGQFRTGNDQIFGALVALTSAGDFPDTTNFSSSDVLGHTLLTLSSTGSDLTGLLNVVIDPGVYALVFGSGYFGATGYGFAPYSGATTVGTPDLIGWHSSTGWQNSGSNGVRFFVNGETVEDMTNPVPEPSTLALLATGALGLVGCARRRIPVAV